MKKIILLLITAVLFTSCCTKSNKSRRFWGGRIDYTFVTEGCSAALGGSHWGDYTFMIVSLPYPNTLPSESHYIDLYDNLKIWGKYEYVGTYAYKNVKYGKSGTVPVYMPKNNFYYIYNKDKKHLIKALNTINIKHTFVAS